MTMTDWISGNFANEPKCIRVVGRGMTTDINFYEFIYDEMQDIDVGWENAERILRNGYDEPLVQNDDEPQFYTEYWLIDSDELDNQMLQFERVIHPFGYTEGEIQSLPTTEHPLGPQTGSVHEADYQGWTNWETWNTYVMLDNEQEYHEAVRKIVADGGTPKDIENYAIPTVIAWTNNNSLKSAQEWNDQPEDERSDPHYDSLSDGGRDLVDKFIGPPDLGDVNAADNMVDPDFVNWQEIHTRIAQDVWENEAYDTPDQFNDEANPYIQQPEPPREWLSSSSLHQVLVKPWQPSNKQKTSSKEAKYRSEIERIADAYDAAPEFDKNAAEAWRRLAEDSAQKAAAFRDRYNIGVTDEAEPYENASQMFEDLDQGNFIVSRANSEHPIWTPDENVDFRIVHDILGHYPTGGDFSWHGENDACNAHAARLTDPEARKALMTECLGQTGSAIRNNGFGLQKTAFLEGYDQPWDWQQMQAVSRVDDNQPCCHRNLRNGGWPPVEEEISIHSSLADKSKEVTRQVKKILPKERKRLKDEPELDDYPNHRQWRINVGETSGKKLVKWLHEFRPDLIAPTSDMEGMWEGQREPAAQAQVINATKDEVEDLLHQYGYDNPQEEAIGVIPEGVGKRNSVLWKNPYNSVKIEPPPTSPYRKIQLPPGVDIEETS